MAPFHRILLVVLSGIMGFLVVIGIAALVKPSSQSTNSSLPAEVISHSNQYVDRWGSKSFDTLTIDQKLVLIHAYYNLENYKLVIQHAETMIDELRALSPERKIAFADMIEDSYRRLGQDHIIIEFREAIDL